jgi:hypothetical protein
MAARQSIEESGVKKAWIDTTLATLSVAIFVNIVLAVVLDEREAGFKLIPMWITLLSLCLVAREMAFSAVLLGLVLCGLSEWVCYFDKPTSVKWQKIPPVLVADFVLLIFIDLLAAVKLENVASRREMEYGSLRKNQNEHVELVEKIKKKQLEGKEAANPEKKEDRAAETRKQTLEMQKAIYVEVMALRYRREVPKVLESMFATWFGMKFGVVFEIAEDTRDLKLRAHWGVSEVRTDALSLISGFKENPIIRFVCDRRDPVTPEDLKKDMVLFDGLQAFNDGLFTLTVGLPVVVQDRPAFIVMLGESREDARLPYEYKLILPVLTAISMSLVKIGSKDARPSFSTFAPGS